MFLKTLQNMDPYAFFLFSIYRPTTESMAQPQQLLKKQKNVLRRQWDNYKRINRFRAGSTRSQMQIFHHASGSIYGLAIMFKLVQHQSSQKKRSVQISLEMDQMVKKAWYFGVIWRQFRRYLAAILKFSIQQ